MTNTMINTMVQGFLVTISMAKLWIWVASLLDKAMPQASATNRWLVTSFNIVWDDDHCTARWQFFYVKHREKYGYSDG
jgi:hypothetical protein